MQIFFIEEKSTNILKTIFKPVQLKEDKIILYYSKFCKKDPVPIANLKKRTCLNCKKILEENNCKNVILSNNLKSNAQFVDFLHNSNISVIKGDNLFKLLLIKIIEKQCIQNNIKPEQSEIAITVNYSWEWLISNIIEFSKKFKNLNIVTNNIACFKKIQNDIYINDGTLITITNNKKKALANSKIIINVDFPQEVINKYRIYENAIIVNLEEKIKINKKRFCGKIINDYNLKFKNGSKIEEDLKKIKYLNFDIKDLAELYLKNNSEELQNIIYLN